MAIAKAITIVVMTNAKSTSKKTIKGNVRPGIPTNKLVNFRSASTVTRAADGSLVIRFHRLDLAQQPLAIGCGSVDLAQPKPGHGELFL
jgi:hypothetical protein